MGYVPSVPIFSPSVPIFSLSPYFLPYFPIFSGSLSLVKHNIYVGRRIVQEEVSDDQIRLAVSVKVCSS
jgi:hypothetical protein